MFARMTAALVAVLALVAGPVGASELLRNEIRTKIAEDVKALLMEERQQAIAIGEFTGPAQLDTNSGPGLQQVLADELRAVGVNVLKQAPFSLKGRYAKVDDKDNPGQLLVKVTVEVFDNNDERKKELSALLRSVGDIARLLGVTVSLPPADEKNAGKRRVEEIQKRLDKPQVFTAGSRVKATADSPYEVELLVQPSDMAPLSPREASVRNGEAHVGIQRSELYAVKVYNHTPHEAGITITIDGLDVFDFSEVRDPKTNRPRYSHYIVPPAKDGQPGSTTIVGWHYRDTPPRNFAKFLVTEYGNGASSKSVGLPKKGKPGVITVTFASATTEGGPRSAGDETGFGPPASVKVQPVKRIIGPVREAVSIRYTAGE